MPPSNHLEALRGDRTGQHSIRINQQWRIYFIWRDGKAHDAEIIHGKRRVTGEYALRLGYFFSMEAQFWVNLQADYDLRKASRIQGNLKKQIHPASKLIAV